MGRCPRENAEVTKNFQTVGTTAGLMVLLAIIWALLQAPAAPSSTWIQQNKWFAVTVVDVYAGLAMAIAIMWVVEDGRKRLAYAALFLVLGNVAVGAWLALRLMGNPSGRIVKAKS